MFLQRNRSNSITCLARKGLITSCTWRRAITALLHHSIHQQSNEQTYTSSAHTHTHTHTKHSTRDRILVLYKHPYDVFLEFSVAEELIARWIWANWKLQAKHTRSIFFSFSTLVIDSQVFLYAEVWHRPAGELATSAVTVSATQVPVCLFQSIPMPSRSICTAIPSTCFFFFSSSSWTAKDALQAKSNWLSIQSYWIQRLLQRPAYLAVGRTLSSVFCKIRNSLNKEPGGRDGGWGWEEEETGVLWSTVPPQFGATVAIVCRLWCGVTLYC